MISIQLKKLEANFERRSGALYWYCDRSTHEASQGGRSLEVAIGLPVDLQRNLSQKAQLFVARIDPLNSMQVIEWLLLSSQMKDQFSYARVGSIGDANQQRDQVYRRTLSRKRLSRRGSALRHGPKPSPETPERVGGKYSHQD